MKTAIKKLLLLLAVFSVNLSVSANIYETFTFDGIRYHVLPDVESSVEMDYNQCSGDIVIPGKVTNEGKEYSVVSVGRSAFSSNMDLTSVNISEGIKLIDASAFWGCYGLKSVSIPNTVDSIGNRAFEGCFYKVNISVSRFY